jgi:hypothetical protein
MRGRCLLVPVAAAALFAAGREGLKPRASAGEYAAHATAGSLTLGAVVLSQDEVRSRFSSELNRGYVVVEVGVFPKEGARVDLGPGDFMLRPAGAATGMRPAGPKAIAAVLQKGSAADREITLHPAVGVGYETGDGYDPYGRRRGGWSTSTGVGVGVGGTRPPASTDADRKTMEMELSEQQLPENVIAAPVAGYLYFPVKLKAQAVYELEYSAGAERVVLKLGRK